MGRALVCLSLLLFLLAGCGSKTDFHDLQPNPILELTDGYCLVYRGKVLLNHHQIEYYDYGAHLIYLKSGVVLSTMMEEADGMSVYAGGEEIYTVTARPGDSPNKPIGPIIWTDPIFYGANIFAITWLPDTEERMEALDPREDSRIVDALLKYKQYRHGLQCEFLSISYESAQEVEVKLTLHNADPVNYYYLDPARMGVDLFHFYTEGLLVWYKWLRKTFGPILDDDSPDPWDSWDPEWLSLLESGETDTLTILYDRFEVVPSGTHPALFFYPGLSYQVDWEDREQSNGRIWLGELYLRGEIVVEEAQGN